MTLSKSLFVSLLSVLLVVAVACGGAASPGGTDLQTAQLSAASSVKASEEGKIAFTRYAPTTDPDVWASDVWLVNPDGTGAIDLTSENPGDDSMVSISPDGRKIAYSAAGGFCGIPNNTIVVMDADGGNKKCLPNTARGVYASWSPNGKKLIFTSNEDGKLYLTKADGTGTPKALTSGPSYDWGAKFSPDGERIVFSSDREAGTSCPAGYCFNLFTMQADGSRITKLTDDALDAWGPSWSPHGNRIAFSTNLSSINSTLFTIKANGRDLTPLTSGSVNDIYPCYSPDGERVAFSRCNDPECSGPLSIFTIDVDGGDRKQVTFGVWDRISSWGPSIERKR